MNPHWIEKFAELPLDVVAAVPLGRMRVADILELRPGMLLRTGSPAGRVDVYVGGARIGAGECSGAATKLIVGFDELGSRP
jgi:flagellar motor switch/type III secretory pathway protein FliN